MLRKLRSPLFLLALAALLAAVGYWNIRPASFMDKTATTADDSAIDFYVTNAHTLQYQAEGKLHYEMTAEKVEHLKTSEVTLLTQPDLLLFRGTPIPWHVRSERGEVSPGGDQVELIDAVRVERTDTQGRPTILTTSRLSVFPEREYAETRQPVKIEAANGVTTAVGMKAYLDDSRMHLLSSVRGQHEVR
ncbi:LPS export ABC transporter periplasmic protein LptC [Azotobacter salinestris]|uniref:LPS export ABC transporter periplasmic protein LptC n=1 Tax=Azotobacter salinestris TaxID=69964 RepID=UPI00142F2540|nr:LPS export ABC transporter periplasmic protein LptC [Azotobacter salinestris]